MLKKSPVNRGKTNGQVHECEFVGDVYNLFNACNGVLHKGALDLRMLNELSEEESQFLNIPRLIEAAGHLASGCVSCAKIVKTLGVSRGVLKKMAEETVRASSVRQ